jgi:hypothetical protein
MIHLAFWLILNNFLNLTFNLWFGLKSGDDGPKIFSPFFLPFPFLLNFIGHELFFLIISCYAPKDGVSGSGGNSETPCYYLALSIKLCIPSAA